MDLTKRFRKCEGIILCMFNRVACYLSPRYCCTIGYRFALACYHGKCRKKVILEYFYESTDAECNSVCCDCCDVNFSIMIDDQKRMIAIAKAVKEIPCKGDKKVSNILGHVSSRE